MNCNIQILTGFYAGKDFDGTITRLGKVVFYVAGYGGGLGRMVTNRSNADIIVRPLQRASLSDVIENSKTLHDMNITDANERDSE